MVIAEVDVDVVMSLVCSTDFIVGRMGVEDTGVKTFSFTTFDLSPDSFWGYLDKRGGNELQYDGVVDEPRDGAETILGKGSFGRSKGGLTGFW